jgi:hypothetical protein
MCAMVFDPYGGPDVLCLRNVPLPEPQGGDVLIRVGYAGVNPADSKARSADLIHRLQPKTLQASKRFVNIEPEPDVPVVVGIGVGASTVLWRTFSQKPVCFRQLSGLTGSACRGPITSTFDYTHT